MTKFKPGDKVRHKTKRFMRTVKTPGSTAFVTTSGSVLYNCDYELVEEKKPPFKVGDLVRCTDTDLPLFMKKEVEKREIYTVDKVYKSGNKTMLRLKEVNLSLFADRFENLTEKKHEEILRQKGGFWKEHFKPGAVTHVDAGDIETRMYATMHDETWVHHPAAPLGSGLKTEPSNPCKENVMSDSDKGTVVKCYSDTSGYVPMGEYSIDQVLKIVSDLEAQNKKDKKSSFSDVPVVKARIKERNKVIKAFRSELNSRS